ncbi:MAG: 5-bromo-4-chloroindolyl phosphate hydrolysis family protein [Candidatus Avoscillospira sp.]
MRNNKKKKPVAPIYGFGLAFLIYSLFFNLSGFGSFIRCIILAAAVYLLLKSIFKKSKTDEAEPEPQPAQEKKAEKKPEPKPEPKKPEPEPVKSTGNPELDAVIRQGRSSVQRIRELNDEIPDYKISAQLKQIEILTASIIDQVEKKEDKLKSVRQFMNYYLPTTIKLLEQYVQMQNVGLKGENIENGMKQIEDMLDKVIVAFQKQLDDLFERDIVDITAEIQVMERMMASQGLTGQKDFEKE